MSNTKNYPCPHCRGSSKEDIDKALEKREGCVLSGISWQSKTSKPKFIIVKCSHCNQNFKAEF